MPVHKHPLLLHLAGKPSSVSWLSRLGLYIVIDIRQTGHLAPLASIDACRHAKQKTCWHWVTVGFNIVVKLERKDLYMDNSVILLITRKKGIWVYYFCIATVLMQCHSLLSECRNSKIESLFCNYFIYQVNNYNLLLTPFNTINTNIKNHENIDFKIHKAHTFLCHLFFKLWMLSSTWHSW